MESYFDYLQRLLLYHHMPLRAYNELMSKGITSVQSLQGLIDETVVNTNGKRQGALCRLFHLPPEQTNRLVREIREDYERFVADEGMPESAEAVVEY